MLLLAWCTACGDGSDEPTIEPPEQPPELSAEGLEAGALSLGDVELGASGARSFTVRNSGGSESGRLAVQLTGASAFVLAPASTCPGVSLPAGATCELVIGFAPEQNGEATASLRLTDEARPDHALEIPLVGRATPRRGVTVTLQGAPLGAVRVRVGGTTTVCRATCTVPAAPGAQVTLKADTPSRFGAFSGDCTSATASCVFTAAPSNAITARFDADPRERLTLLFPGAQVQSVDYDSLGNLVIGTSAYVTKVSRTGAELWKRALPGQARVGAGNVVLVRNGATLTKLDAAGATLWSVSTVSGGCNANPNAMARTWTTMPDGGVAIQGPSALVVHDANGDVRFTTGPIGPACRGALAVGSDNRIYTGVENISAEPTDLLVFEASGATAPTIENAAPQYHLALAARNGRVAVASSGHSRVSLRTLTTLGPYTTVDDPDYVEHGVALDDDGEVVSAYALREDTAFVAAGVAVRRYSPTLQQRWALTKEVIDEPLALEITGVTVFDLTLDDGSGDLALGGRYASPTFDGGWVEIFAER